MSWDISATYSLNDDINLYARIADSFRAPAIQGRTLFGNLVTVADSETIISFEAGFKSELFDNTMRFNFAGFYYEMSDQQLTAVGGAGGNVTALVNADKTIGYGIEMDLEWAPIDNVFITGSLGYNEVELDDPGLQSAICAFSAPTFVTPICTVRDPVTFDPATFSTFASIDGNTPPRTPSVVASWSFRYGKPVGNGEVYFLTDWAYTSSIDNNFFYDSVEYELKSKLLGGIRLGYNFGNEKYDIAFYGRNITDELSIDGGIDFIGGNLGGFLNDNEPQLWGVELTARF